MIFTDFWILVRGVCFNKISLPFTSSLHICYCWALTYLVSRRRALLDHRSTTPYVVNSWNFKMYPKELLMRLALAVWRQIQMTSKPPAKSITKTKLHFTLEHVQSVIFANFVPKMAPSCQNWILRQLENFMFHKIWFFGALRPFSITWMCRNVWLFKE